MGAAFFLCSHQKMIYLMKASLIPIAVHYSITYTFNRKSSTVNKPHCCSISIGPILEIVNGTIFTIETS